MRNRCIYLAMMAVVAIVATCCSVEDDNSGYPSMTELMGNNGQMPNGMMPGGMGQNDNSGNDLQDFDISLNTAALTSETENIPTDENDESYEDYIEHSSFSETVSIVYADNEATVSTLPDGVEATVDGAGVIINSTIAGVAYELKGSKDQLVGFNVLAVVSPDFKNESLVDDIGTYRRAILNSYL